MKKMVLLCFSIMILTGCISGSFNYNPPAKRTYNKTVVVPKNKNEVWKNAISKLSSSFFVINNIDKDSGLINLSYSANPYKYIDCGEIISTVNNARGERIYKFPASSQYKEYEIFADGNILGISRKLSLEGRVNLVISEKSESETSVTVNAKYVISRDYKAANVLGQSQSLNDTISFGTDSFGEFGIGTNSGAGTVCYPNFSLEQEIINSIIE